MGYLANGLSYCNRGDGAARSDGYIPRPLVMT